MQHIEVIVFAELFDLREERTESLWMSSFSHIAMNWKNVRRIDEK